MAEFNVPAPGTICWRELATRDLDKAVDFYTQLFGWELNQSKLAPMNYKEIHLDGTAVGGMMAIDESWGPEPPPSFWNSYVAVESADGTVEKIRANGGSIMHGPFDAPGIGRMAICVDPAGAAFAIIQFTTG